MAVDHGLGGKDSQRSRDKREKRARKQKAFARKALTGGNKKEVKFDENSRVEWLTGSPKYCHFNHVIRLYSNILIILV